MANGLYYYSWHPKDAQTDESYLALTFEERGFFHACLDASWLNDGLPVDPIRRARVVGATQDEHDRLWTSIERMFERRSERLFNARLERERITAERLREQRSAAGRKSGESRRKDSGLSHEQPLNERSNTVRTRAYDSDSLSNSVDRITITDIPLEANKQTFSAFASETSYNETKLEGGPVYPPVATERNGAHKAEQESASVEEAAGIMDELQRIYRSGGVPIPTKHVQICAQLLLSIDPPERRSRVPQYCKWAFVTGRWPNPAKTKSLLNVLRDGDWDVDIVPRTLPNAPTEKTGIQLAIERGMEELRQYRIRQAKDRAQQEVA